MDEHRSDDDRTDDDRTDALDMHALDTHARCDDPTAGGNVDLVRLVPGFRPPVQAQPDGPIDATTLAQADAAMRHWHSPLTGPLVPGTERHRYETCRMFRDTFHPYRPTVLEWPRLDAATRARIVGLPIWDIAVQTEDKARLRMAAYAATLGEPDMRNAIAQNAWEEQRHRQVLTRLVAAYGIALAPAPPQAWPADPEWAYLVTGYSECIDSFFAFGLFEVARRAGLFPQTLVDTFEPVMQEECRHILLFANWAAWHRARLPPRRRLRFELRVAAAWCYLGWERIGLARALDADPHARAQGHAPAPAQDHNFTLHGARSVSADGIALRDLLELCLRENARRFAGYDARLRRPTTVPRLARLALGLLRLARLPRAFARRR